SASAGLARATAAPTRAATTAAAIAGTPVVLTLRLSDTAATAPLIFRIERAAPPLPEVATILLLFALDASDFLLCSADIVDDLLCRFLDALTNLGEAALPVRLDFPQLSVKASLAICPKL